MSIEVTCDRCNNDIEEQAALAFGPPTEYKKSLKLHICLRCWEDFLKWMIAGINVGHTTTIQAPVESRVLPSPPTQAT